MREKERSRLRGSLSAAALEFGLSPIAARHGRVADMPPLPDSSKTAPNLVLSLPVRLEEDESRVLAEGAVCNIRELV